MVASYVQSHASSPPLRRVFQQRLIEDVSECFCKWIVHIPLVHLHAAHLPRLFRELFAQEKRQLAFDPVAMDPSDPTQVGEGVSITKKEYRIET